MTCVSSLPMALADCLDIVETALATLTRRLPVNVARDDLASIGKLALIAALGQRDGDPDDVRAYCYVRVRGAMLDELRRLDPLSRRQRDRVGLIARARTELANRLGRVPTLGEIASATQLTMAEVSSAIDAAAQAADATEIEWDSIPDTQLPSPAEVVELDDVRASLGIALDRLPPNQALALRRYYLEDATLDEIAVELGVSRERARQVREAGEKKLRADFVVLALWQSFVNRSRD
ncbi:RNA polymerase sigma factor, sigma-70 family [Opitutaceae bacterium TAV1]|nr:RNA polymerase sigma factor, sigma-70 family [Opitutaceae bacterium TAV1]